MPRKTSKKRGRPDKQTKERKVSTETVKRGQVWARDDSPACYYIRAVYEHPKDVPDDLKLAPGMEALFPIAVAETCEFDDGKVYESSIKNRTVLRTSWFQEFCELKVEKVRKPRKGRYERETRPYNSLDKRSRGSRAG